MSDDNETESPLDSPSPPTSPDETPSLFGSPHAAQNNAASAVASTGPAPTVSNMTASSTPLGNVNAARRPPGALPPRGAAASAMNPDIAARMKAFTISRSNPPQRPHPSSSISTGPLTPTIQSPGGQMVGGIPASFKLPPHLNRPVPHMSNSSPVVPTNKGPSLAEKRGLKFPGGLAGAQLPPTQLPAQLPAAQQSSTPSTTTVTSTAAPSTGRQKPKMTLSDMRGGQSNGAAAQQERPAQQSQMEKYADFIDTKTGALKFKGQATIHGSGIDFSSGRSFSISLDEVDTLDELGKGNYGTVYKVRHARPRIRKPGQGLAGNKSRTGSTDNQPEDANSAASRSGTTGVVMAMKEMRLELDDAKFQTIIMELDVLHRCVSPYIVDFYGAFFQEGAVYICMEWMDGGSIDKLYGDGIPENVLRKITLATAQGLKSLKEEHNIIHRDVKPTNILMNTKGHVKLCDFGVSGNLVASIAKTNIGCQSYMAPERISTGGMAQAGAGTYSVQSDIWSLGLTIIECALGRYPYPPETYDNIFSQLSAIVDGVPPDLPADKFSTAARDFVAGCLNKIPKLRPTYPMLLQHAWLAPLLKPDVITEEDEEAAEATATNGDPIAQPSADTDFHDKEVGEWVIQALENRRTGKTGKSTKPALHAVALDVVSPNPADVKPVAVEV